MNPITVLSLLLSLSTPVEVNQRALITCSAPCMLGLKAPIVIEVNDFTPESARDFEVQMNAAQATGQSIIPVVIDSYGGSVVALLRMVDVIKASKIPVATIVESKAMSCGAVLFMMGKEGYRFAGDHATILIHSVSGGVEGKVKDLHVSVEEATRLNNIVFTLMSTSTGHAPDYFAKLLKDKSDIDWYISVEDAKRMNIVNHIGVPEFKTRVEAHYTLE
jgi:ATP-dependent Clp protease protease subunit